MITRAYGAIAPEPLGCALHSYLLTEESVMDKRTNEQTSPIINTDLVYSKENINTNGNRNITVR